MRVRMAILCSLLLDSLTTGFQRVTPSRLNRLSTLTVHPSTHATSGSAGQITRELSRRNGRGGEREGLTMTGDRDGDAHQTKRRLPNALLPVAFALVFFSSVLAEPANAAYGSSGAAVTSPAVVKSLTLEEFLNLPEKKQRQFEGEPRFARQWCCGLWVEEQSDELTKTCILLCCIQCINSYSHFAPHSSCRRLPLLRRDRGQKLQERQEASVQARERHRRPAQRHEGGREEVLGAVPEGSGLGRGVREAERQRGGAEAKRRVASRAGEALAEAEGKSIARVET